MDEGADGSTATFVAAQRYEIIEEVGRGGMGLIYKARDRRLNRIVALKRLPENLRDHPKALQLFLNEAQAAARLNHPNIVTVFDTDQEDGTFFITLELLQGYPLNVILKQRSRLGPRDTARIGSQVARGLQYAHDQQVVHRDIKTANLFLTHEKVVKIMDFGLAKMMEEVRRGSTVIGGTPSYMAPEQATGDRVDHRADLYSLGITLFELAVGHVPFQKGEVAYHHRHTEPPDPRSLADGIPDALAELILQLLRKDPDARCGSAEEVQKRLERIIEG
jgi:serine/threonine protein kinase